VYIRSAPLSLHTARNGGSLTSSIGASNNGKSGSDILPICSLRSPPSSPQRGEIKCRIQFLFVSIYHSPVITNYLIKFQVTIKIKMQIYTQLATGAFILKKSILKSHIVFLLLNFYF
jgi:hypothetical protein